MDDAGLDLFEQFCKTVLTDPDRAALVLYPEQLLMLGDYFDGVRETLILLPKKNGKTGLAAALALHHVLTTEYAEAYFAAASRDQAARVLDALSGYVRRSPELSRLVRLKQREAIVERNHSFIRVLAADVDTSDGVTPTLAIVDELHRHRSGELAGLLRDGLGPRDGRMLTISTAGDSEDTPLGKLRAAALELPGIVQEGTHRYVRSGKSFAFHEWALDPEADVENIELVKSANPASWITLEELRQRHDSPSMRSWQWKRFACGIWSKGEFGAFEPSEWAACADPKMVIPDNAKGPYIGVDLGWKWDTTAIVPNWSVGGGWKEQKRQVRAGDAWGRGAASVREWVRVEGEQSAYVGKPVILAAPGDGTSLSVETVFSACAEMAERWPGSTFVLDPMAGGEHLAQRLDAELEDVRVVTYSQAHGPMCRASQRLGEMIASGRIHHPDDEGLNKHVLACGVRQVGGSWRLGKQQGSKAPIDAAVALAMAISAGIDDGGGDEPPKAPPGGYKAMGFA
jgi:phage terminase large subunit-like protein